MTCASLGGSCAGEFGFDLGEHRDATMRAGRAQTDIAINASTVEICRPAETELDPLDPQLCAAHHLPDLPPAASGQESYPPPSDQPSTKPWRRPLPSKTQERCRGLGNGPRNWSGCSIRTIF
jgi:hypothetical protein